MAFVILLNWDSLTYLLNQSIFLFKGQCAAKQPLTKNICRIFTSWILHYLPVLVAPTCRVTVKYWICRWFVSEVWDDMICCPVRHLLLSLPAARTSSAWYSGNLVESRLMDSRYICRVTQPGGAMCIPRLFAEPESDMAAVMGSVVCCAAAGRRYRGLGRYYSLIADTISSTPGAHRKHWDYFRKLDLLRPSCCRSLRPIIRDLVHRFSRQICRDGGTGGEWVCKHWYRGRRQHFAVPLKSQVASFNIVDQSWSLEVKVSINTVLAKIYFGFWRLTLRIQFGSVLIFSCVATL